MTIQFDEARLVETANAIRLVNPHARNYSVAGLVQNMKDTANREYPHGCGYVSTLGYVLTVWADRDGTRHCLPSVMAYSVMQHCTGRQ